MVDNKLVFVAAVGNTNAVPLKYIDPWTKRFLNSFHRFFNLCTRLSHNFVFSNSDWPCPAGEIVISSHFKVPEWLLSLQA